MSKPLLVVADLVAIACLAFGLYFPRYRRRDIVVAVLGLNVGVLAVALTLASATVTLGFGFGLFGVLSIIRLRSAELDQEEVAYYFSALALGLLGGIEVSPDWLATPLMAAIVVALFVGDHPRLFPDNRNQVMTLDVAYTDEEALVARLEELLGCKVQRMKVRRVNLVTNSTVVDVRYRLHSRDRTRNLS